MKNELYKKILLHLYVRNYFAKVQTPDGLKKRDLFRYCFPINWFNIAKDIGIISLFFLFILGLFAAWITFTGHSFKNEPSLINNLSFGGVLVGQVLFCFLFMLMTYQEGIKDSSLLSLLKVTFVYLLLSLIPNKIRLFLSIRPWLNRGFQRRCRRINEDQQSQLHNDFWVKVETEIKKDIPSFLAKYQLNKKSFIRFFKERCFTYYGDLDYGFVSFFLMIPNKSQIPLDSLKRILINNQFGEESRRKVVEFLTEHKDYNLIWSSHSVQDLELIFSRRHEPQELCYLLENYLYNNSSPEPIPRSNNYDDLVLNIRKTIDYQKEIQIEEMSNLIGNEIKIEPYLLVRLKTYEDFYHAGNTLKNCLRNGPLSKESKVFAIYEEGKMKAAVSLGREFNIEQIKGKGNSDFIGQHLITGYFQSLKTKNDLSMLLK